MAGVDEGKTGRPALRSLAQVAAAGGTGALTLLVGSPLSLAAAMTGGIPFGVLTAFLLAAAGIGLLVAVASIAPEASWLTQTMRGRTCWAVLVGGLGTAGLLLSWNISEAAGLGLGRHMLVWLPLGTVPFALVAGLLLRRWYLAVGSLALCVASAVWLLNALAATLPEQTEANARVQAAGRDRSEFVVTQIPGYHAVRQVGAWQLEPDDPAAIPPPRYITLYTSLDDPTPDCEFNPRDSELQGFPCTVERPGLTYIKAVAAHGYFLRTGSTLLQIVGSPAVDQTMLRDAVLRAAPSADPAFYTVDIPGYTSMKTGIRQGISFQFADQTQIPAARYVELAVTKGSTAGQCAVFEHSGYLECVGERPDLFYRRLTDKHVYLHQRGGVEVRVLGGLGVDRNLLRDAALAARPATDEELLTMLPPAPNRPGTFMDSVKVFAKRVFS
jgi:hypothetical protein